MITYKDNNKIQLIKIIHKVQRINLNFLRINNIFKRINKINIFKRINQDQNKTLILVKITIKNKIIRVNTQ